MRSLARGIYGSLLACGALLLVSPSAADAQFGPMSCIECHTDPAGGGVHRGFSGLTNLTEDQLDAMCITCHDGSYTNPLGVDAPEAAVHQNKNPGQQRDEFGDFKASCRDCHTSHSHLLAGDGTANTNQNLLGREVEEASSSDGIGRIRKPVILDVNGDNGGSGNQRFEDDVQTGFECSSGIPDDPACIETVPPAAADGVRKITFYLDIDTAGTHWASSSPPYTGACNGCHTRTGHHRRDDSGGDHTHNVSRNCDDCHNHKDGWVNKGG